MLHEVMKIGSLVWKAITGGAGKGRVNCLSTLHLFNRKHYSSSAVIKSLLAELPRMNSMKEVSFNHRFTCRCCCVLLWKPTQTVHSAIQYRPTYKARDSFTMVKPLSDMDCP